MTTEDPTSYDRENLSEKHSLDELAKGMAKGTLTRRRMLKLAGAALLGGVISAAFPGIAEARHRRRSIPCIPACTGGPSALTEHAIA